MKNAAKKPEVRLTADYSKAEDVRSLTVRVSEENLRKIYGDDLSKYRDGTPVLIDKGGKKVTAIVQGPLKISENLGNKIQMDEWIRRRLNVKVSEEVTLTKTRFTIFRLFWGTMILRHPNISQRWENFGIFLAIITLWVDISLRSLECGLGIEELLIVVPIMGSLILFLLPLVLIPRR